MRHGLDGSLVAPCRFAVFLKNGLKGDCASGSHGAPPRGVTLGVVAEVNRRGTISMGCSPLLAFATPPAGPALAATLEN